MGNSCISSYPGSAAGLNRIAQRKWSYLFSQSFLLSVDFLSGDP